MKASVLSYEMSRRNGCQGCYRDGVAILHLMMIPMTMRYIITKRSLTRDFRNELVAIAASNEIDFDQVMAVVRQEWSVLIRDHLMNHVISSNYGALEIGAIVESMVDHIQKRR